MLRQATEAKKRKRRARPYYPAGTLMVTAYPEKESYFIRNLTHPGRSYRQLTVQSHDRCEFLCDAKLHPIQTHGRNYVLSKTHQCEWCNPLKDQLRALIDREIHPVLPPVISAGCHDYYYVICAKGHYSWEVKIKDLTKGKRCPTCIKEEKERGLLIKVDPELYGSLDMSKNPVGSCDNVQSGCHEKRWFHCRANPEHPSFERAVRDMFHGTAKCPHCKWEERFEPNVDEETKKTLDREKSYESIAASIAAGSKRRIFYWFCDHVEHDSYPATSMERLVGLKRCPVCHPKATNESDFSVAVKVELFTLTEKPWTTEKQFPELRFTNALKFDFYLSAGNKFCKEPIVVETDGRQHFEGKSFDSSYEDYPATCIRDRIKNYFCKRHGIHLLRIGYTESKNYRQHLRDFLHIIQHSSTVRQVFVGREYTDEYRQMALDIPQDRKIAIDSSPLF